MTLPIIDYFKSAERTSPPQPADTPRPRGVELFVPGNTALSELSFSRNAAIAPQGTRTASILEDRSTTSYGSAYDDLWVDSDDKTHKVTIDLKAGTSPLSQIVMHFLGGTEKVYYAFIDTRSMTATGEGAIARTSLDDGWTRITLAGANNKSGNTTLRIQIYPRHGKPEDVGSLYIANARLDP